MKSENLKYWTTLLANLGVFVGLLFLVLEMRQNSAVATAQARMEYGAAWRSIDAARQEKSFAELINKSLVEPETLSVTEIIQLDAYYWGVVDQMLNAQISSQAGVRLTSFESMVSQTVPIYFANRFARNWWQQVREGWTNSDNLEFQRIVDDAISAMNEAEDSNQYEDMQRKMSTQLGTTIMK
jgi:hypothetical protein